MRSLPGAQQIDDPDLAVVLELWIGLVRTLGHAAAGQQAADARREAVAAALPLGDPVLTARAMTAWDTPMGWATHEYAVADSPLMAELVALVGQLAAMPDDPAIAELRCRLLAMHGMEMEGTGDPAAMASARASVELARELGVPQLTAYALDGLSRQFMGNVGYDERLAAAQECLDVATEHELAGFAGLGHFFLEQAAAAVGDLDAAARHGDELARLGRTYGLPGLVVVSMQVPAVVALARGDLDEARRRYTEFGDALESIGAFAVDALRWLAEWLIALQEDRVAATVRVAREATAAYPPLGPILVHTLLAAGERDAAAEVFARRVPPRRDLLWSMYAVLDAENALLLGDERQLRVAYDELAMAAGELGGAASGFFTVWPVDTTMARVARRLGLVEEARSFAGAAVALAGRVGNARWLREAEAEVAVSA